MIDFSTVTDIMLGNQQVTQIEDSLGNVLWSGTPTPPAPTTDEYFYVEDISGFNNTLSINKNHANAPTIEVFYSTDQTNWVSMGTTDTTAITATVPADKKLYLKATTDGWCDEINNNYSNNISISNDCNIGGNIMSLLYGDNFQNQNTFPNNSKQVFGHLFTHWGGNPDNRIVNAGDLILPATTLTQGCYSNMFSGCTSLTTAPALPATTLTQGCYSNMFSGCTSLTTAPALPATTLAEQCYYSMFKGCTSLTTAPALPATTLAEQCYNIMFSNCTSLTTAPVLPATTLAQSCYASMFYGTSLTTAPALPAETLAQSCYRSMFSNCTALTTAPVLPAETLAQSCYRSMFSNCTALTTAPALPVTTLVSSCYREMFKGCTSLTTAPALPATTLAEQCYYSMFQGCRSLNTVTTYADDISATACINGWLVGVAATGDFYNLGNPAPTYPSGVSGIPQGWTEHTSL